MKKKLLSIALMAMSYFSFAQVYTKIHSPDDCKVLTSQTINSTYTESVTNPDGSDTANPNVSSVLASANNGTVDFDLGYSIVTGTNTINYKFRYFSVNSGALNSGSGRFIVRLFNSTQNSGTYLNLEIVERTGGSWQEITGSFTPNSVTKGDIADVTANGGFDRLRIVASNNAASIETLYFDDIEFSDVTAGTILSDVTADLDSGNAWAYNNSPDLIASRIVSVNASTITTDEPTPSIVGNDSPTVIKIVRGTGTSSGIRFDVPNFVKGSTNVKVRIFPSCDLDNTPNVRLQIRPTSGSAANYAKTLINNQWNEVSFDLSNDDDANTANNGSSYNQLLFFLDSGSSLSDGRVFYMDALQMTALTATYNGNGTNFSTTTNWDIGATPNALYNVDIPTGLANQPVIDSSGTFNVNNLTIGDGSTLTISNGGSLIISGAYAATGTGNLRYRRTLDYKAGNTEGWHLIASPVSGQAFSDEILNTYDIATSGTNRGLATYNNSVATNHWDYFQNGESGTFGNGVGYSIKVDPDPVASSGEFVFEGSAKTGDITDIVLTNNVSGFNLIGNPFTSSIDANTLLIKNSGLLATQTIWIWDQDTKVYNTYNQNSDYKINPTQGFFVDAVAGASTFTISQSMLSHETDAFLKSASSIKNSSDKTKITLTLYDQSNTNNLEIYYNSKSTLSFDNGYDSPMFGGLSMSLPFYSSLLENNNGMKLAIQSLPNSDYENMAVPIGVKVAKDKEITFTAEALNLPSGIKVYLEDKENNTFTDLQNNNYKVLTTNDLDGIGRFYIHTASSSLNISNQALSANINIYKTENTNLRITGLAKGNSNLKLFNILGRQVMDVSFFTDGTEDITLPKLSTGVYIIQLETELGKLNKKIILE